MKLPKLSVLSQSRLMTDKFLGYNANLRCSDGEFSEMENMTGALYPVMSPRTARETFYRGSGVNGITSKEALIYVKGSDVVIGNTVIPLGLSTISKPKQLVSMGAYLCVFPDKKYINTKNMTDYGAMEAEAHTHEGNIVTLTLCNADYESYNVKTVGSKAPSAPSNGEYWLDTSKDSAGLKVWNETSGIWVGVATTYVKIQGLWYSDENSPVLNEVFAEGDGVTVSGIESSDDLNGTMIIQAVGRDYIVVTGLINNAVTQKTAVTIERRVPQMDYVCESENRLWGCYYGMKNGETVNEIYASKLGDFRNWNCYEGLSTDSYTVSVGSDGPFTGAITHLGYPLFFKERCIHKIYGSYPAQYSLQTTVCRGVQEGCYRSLQIVNEILYYKSISDICAYDGSLPATVSTALGSETYHNAAAGHIRGRYYISMQDSNDNYHMFVYDTERGMWHREDSTHAEMFAEKDGRLYFINAAGSIDIVDSASYEGVSWSATTGIFGYSYPDNKYVSRFNVRMMLSEDASVEILCEYDSSGDWISQGTIKGNGIGSFTVPVQPVRCDHMRIRFAGTGECKIYSITKILEEGSDV